MTTRRGPIQLYSWCPAELPLVGLKVSPRRAKTSNPESLGEAQSLNQGPWPKDLFIFKPTAASSSRVLGLMGLGIKSCLKQECWVYN